ncbi:GDSL esterase/lipase At5g45910-like isoform X2 [Curcuma longa]|uniref:GDSL esterase/lipase At5g45910-like isoform X2 n=1 Tax=Curcuma longa TaxID=136217 RepID=UPI003D9EEA6E
MGKQLFFLLCLFLLCFFSSHPASARRYNALFNFGDSLSDTGNVVLAGLPYGMTYFGHHTGRCSDGRLVIDFIAEGIGLPHLPPSTANNTSFLRGANFAFIAAPALPFDFFHQRGLSHGLHVNASLHEQIDRFQKLLPSICGSPQDCKDFLRKSLLVVGEFGGNDYNTGLFGGWSVTKVTSFVPHVTRVVADGIESVKLTEIDRPRRGGSHRAFGAASRLLPPLPHALRVLRFGRVRPSDWLPEEVQCPGLVPQRRSPAGARPAPEQVPGGVDPLRRLLRPALRFRRRSSQIRI